jgi:hypothetical protein
MALRQLFAIPLVIASGLVQSTLGADAPSNSNGPQSAGNVSVATESPCKVNGDVPAAGSGYFDLGQNRFGCWPNETLPGTGTSSCEPSVCENSAAEGSASCNPCGENPPCDEDYWTSQSNRRIVLATVGMTIFRSDFHGTSLSNQSADFAPGNDGAFSSVTYSPRVLLESQGPQWGFLGRFWYLSDGDGDFTPLGIGGSAIGLNSTSRTRACTTDFEANRRWDFLGCGELDTSFGVRYASLTADGVLSSVSVVGPNVYDTFSGESTQFNGTGLTSGVSVRVPIAENSWLCRGCTLCMFGNVRGSAVFGKSDSDTTASSRITTGLGSAALVDTDAVRETSTLLMGETSCGLEWDRRWTCIPADAFFRIAAEYQAWSVTSPAISDSATSLTAAGLSANATAHASDTGLSLVGVALTTGFTW